MKLATFIVFVAAAAIAGLLYLAVEYFGGNGAVFVIGMYAGSMAMDYYRDC